MSTFGRIPASLLLGLTLFIIGCDSVGGSDPTATLSVRPEDEDGLLLEDGRVFFNGDAAEGTGVATKSGIAPGTSVDIEARAQGRVTQDTSVTVPDDISDGEEIQVDLVLPEDHPDEVTIEFRVRDAQPDTAVVAEEITADGQTVGANTNEATAQLSYSEEAVTARAEATYFQVGTAEFTPDHDQTVTIGLERKSVTVSAQVEDDTSTVGVIDPWTSDTTTSAGSITVDRPARSGDRIVFGKGRSWEVVEERVSAGESHDLSLDIPHIAVCENGLDDDDDGRADENDPGCLDEDGNYEPSDTSEHHVFSRTVWISSKDEGDNDTLRVSSQKDERKFYYPYIDQTIKLPASIVDAVVTGASIDAKKDSMQADETIAATFKCGPTRDNLNNSNSSGIAPDTQTQDGWGLTILPEVDIEFFDTGRYCRVIFKHGTLVRGEPAGDGNDDVVHLLPDGEQRAFVIYFFVEAEDYQGKASWVQTHSQDGFNTPRMQAIRNGYPEE